MLEFSRTSSCPAVTRSPSLADDELDDAGRLGAKLDGDGGPHQAGHEQHVLHLRDLRLRGVVLEAGERLARPEPPGGGAAETDDQNQHEAVFQQPSHARSSGFATSDETLKAIHGFSCRERGGFYVGGWQEGAAAQCGGTVPPHRSVLAGDENGGDGGIKPDLPDGSPIAWELESFRLLPYHRLEIAKRSESFDERTTRQRGAEVVALLVGEDAAHLRHER